MEVIPDAGDLMPIAKTLAYGAHPDAVADIHLPATSGPAPLIVFLHGGFWRSIVNRKYAEPVADTLAAAGYVVANVEYRRTGGGGGWPVTFTDVARAFDTLPALIEREWPGLADPERIVYVGHSAGGQLGIWGTLRHRLPLGAPGRTETPPRVAGVVALAPVADLATAYALGSGEGAVADLLEGGPDVYPDRYAALDPSTLGPSPVPVVVVHGDQDQRVPIAMGRDYCAATGAELIELPGIGHFELADPASAAWPPIAAAVRRLAG
ncbi:alpha/beta hydrolase fold domain-containing protein [Nocardia terpenica]|uniref:Alpha/beta hydrolase fold domain-containing protein n=2 Tax=Nocardia terpenica TaxID=455432 RepID=A0A6G9YWQ7_9NOCA|nr:alpha/beta hydrolase fold domain-containing protein [Nocardia terpenica]